jgi:hypothetical protein
VATQQPGLMTIENFEEFRYLWAAFLLRHLSQIVFPSRSQVRILLRILTQLGSINFLPDFYKILIKIKKQVKLFFNCLRACMVMSPLNEEAKR